MQYARNRFPFTPEPKWVFPTEKNKKAKGERMLTLPEIALMWQEQALPGEWDETRTSGYQ